PCVDGRQRAGNDPRCTGKTPAEPRTAPCSNLSGPPRAYPGVCPDIATPSAWSTPSTWRQPDCHFKRRKVDHVETLGDPPVGNNHRCLCRLALARGGTETAAGQEGRAAVRAAGPAAALGAAESADARPHQRRRATAARRVRAGAAQLLQPGDARRRPVAAVHA